MSHELSRHNKPFLYNCLQETKQIDFRRLFFFSHLASMEVGRPSRTRKVENLAWEGGEGRCVLLRGSLKWSGCQSMKQQFSGRESTGAQRKSNWTFRAGTAEDAAGSGMRRGRNDMGREQVISAE